MCRDCGDRPTSVEDFIRWHRSVFPYSDFNYEHVTADTIRTVDCFVRLVCNICGHDTTDLGKNGQKIKNIWYSHRGCGGCVGNVSRPPEIWRSRAIEIYEQNNVNDDLSSFLPATPSERASIICGRCGETYYKRLKDIMNDSDGRTRLGHEQCNRIAAGYNRRRTRVEFIRRAIEVHSFRSADNDGIFPYNYDRVPDRPANTDLIDIFCLICNDWFPSQQRVSDHLSGHGCQRCSGSIPWTVERLLTSIEENDLTRFVELDLTQLPSEINSRTVLNLRCIEHRHTFSRSLSNFIHSEGGANCLTCSYIERGRRRRTTREQFVQRSLLHHHDEQDQPIYLYDLIPETMVNTDIVDIGCINCRNNGFDTYFQQVVMYHVAGHGCRRCNPGGFNFDLPAVLYLLLITDSTGLRLYWKLGITNASAQERADDIRQSMRRLSLDWNIEVVAFTVFGEGREAFETEQAIISFRDEFYQEEQFTPMVKFEGWTELFPIQDSPFDIGEEIGLLNRGQFTLVGDS